MKEQIPQTRTQWVVPLTVGIAIGFVVGRRSGANRTLDQVMKMLDEKIASV